LACLLVDARRGLMVTDHQAATMLAAAGVPFQARGRMHALPY
jgi:hypothetical protein